MQELSEGKTTTILCPECDRVFLIKDGEELYCSHCRDHIKVGKARTLKCPDDDCGGELSFDIVEQGYRCQKCHTLWGRSSVEKPGLAKAGKLIGC